MRFLIPMLVLMAWSLWFGGIVMLFVAVNSLFHTFGTDRATAGLGATGLFHRFEIYQLILGGIAIVGTVLWRTTAPSKMKRWLLMCLLAAAVLGVSSMAFITPRIDALRMERMTNTPEFAKLHGLSMILYLCEAGFLLVAGMMLFVAIRAENTAQQEALSTPAQSEAPGRM